MYVPAILGLAMVEAAPVELRLDPVHVYVYPPRPPVGFAVSVTDDVPDAHHAVGPLAVMVRDNEEPVTFTVTASLAVHPFLSVTVTVYGVVDPIPCTVGLDVSDEESPAAGAHKYV